MTRRHEYLSRPLSNASRRLARKYDKAEVHRVYQKSRTFYSCRSYNTISGKTMFATSEASNNVRITKQRIKMHKNSEGDGDLFFDYFNLRSY